MPQANKWFCVKNCSRQQRLLTRRLGESVQNQHFLSFCCREQPERTLARISSESEREACRTCPGTIFSGDGRARHSDPKARSIQYASLFTASHGLGVFPQRQLTGQISVFPNGGFAFCKSPIRFLGILFFRPNPCFCEKLSHYGYFIDGNSSHSTCRTLRQASLHCLGYLRFCTNGTLWPRERP